MMIDLRSDTVTRPTTGMRRAMYEAEVGDDCFGDDPSVRALEDYCAEYFNKEAALFTTGGTLSNQIAMKSLTSPGDEVILEAGSHINYYESAATACFSGVNFSIVYSDTGIIDVSDITRIQSSKCRWNANYAQTKVVVLENTLGCRGGRVYPVDTLSRVFEHARSLGAYRYLDGARILHAAAATGKSVTAFTDHADLMATCLSKGLGAPVGSVLVGSAELIARARRYRKWFGGDMHQAGILAAGGLYAMKHHIERLNEDHEHAQLLFLLLSDVEGAQARYEGTNMVFFNVSELGLTSAEFAELLARAGVAALNCPPHEVRFVPHLGITREQVVKAAAMVKRVVAELDTTARPAVAPASSGQVCAI
jgi:threonine aldolase